MPVWLSTHNMEFPDPAYASPEGILAVGGNLSTERLLRAYAHGIFPWYSGGEPILWWCPDPRFVLYPDRLRVSKSMRPYFNQNRFSVTYDQQFTQVIKHCKTTYREGQYGTWITEEMQRAYVQLHELGYAHSVEVWADDELVGGLYGVALGKVFFGESMFAHRSNASKFGFISLVRELTQRGYELIDCQQQTPHLASLGAEAIPRTTFLEILEKNREETTAAGRWNW